MKQPIRNLTPLERRIMELASRNADACSTDYAPSESVPSHAAVLAQYRAYISGIQDALRAVETLLDPARKPNVGAYLERSVADLVDRMLEWRDEAAPMTTDGYDYLDSKTVLKALVKDACGDLRLSKRVTEACQFVAVRCASSNSDIAEHLAETFGGTRDRDKEVDAARQVAREAKQKIEAYFEQPHRGGSLPYRLRFDTINHGGPWCFWFVPPEHRDDVTYVGTPLVADRLIDVIESEKKRRCEPSRVDQPAPLDEPAWPRIPNLENFTHLWRLSMNVAVDYDAFKEARRKILSVAQFLESGMSELMIYQTASAITLVTQERAMARRVIVSMTEQHTDIQFGHDVPVAMRESVARDLYRGLVASNLDIASSGTHSTIYYLSVPGARAESAMKAIKDLAWFSSLRHATPVRAGSNVHGGVALSYGIPQGRTISVSFSNPDVSRARPLGERHFTSVSAELGVSDDSGVGVRNEDELVSWLTEAPTVLERERLTELYVLPVARAMMRD